MMSFRHLLNRLDEVRCPAIHCPMSSLSFCIYSAVFLCRAAHQNFFDAPDSLNTWGENCFLVTSHLLFLQRTQSSISSTKLRILRAPPAVIRPAHSALSRYGFYSQLIGDSNIRFLVQGLKSCPASGAP